MGNNYLALDVGGSRIGVAVASEIARLARPLATLDAGPAAHNRLQQVIADEEIGILVIGLPRNLRGEDTPQTVFVREFARNIEAQLGLPIVWQDEALTSKKAENELKARGKTYEKGDIDALAATFILEDYLRDHPRKNV